MNVYRILGVAVLWVGVSMCWGEAIDAKVDTEQKPWTHLNALNNPDEFQFAIVTDRTGGHRPGIFMDGVRRLNLMQPEFVMSVSDLIEGYTENQEVLDKEWVEFNGFVEQLEMPFFYLPGNHDISNDYMTKDWERRFGPTYYHFIYRDVLFLCLNSEDPPDTQMGDEQVAYIEKVLAENTDVRWTMVFLHKPLWVYPDKKNWKKVEGLLADRKHNVFAGHTHNYMRYERNDSEYIVLATLGGGSGLRGPSFGEFDHFMWVTMTEEGPRIANLLLDGIWDTQVRTPQHSALVRATLNGSVVRTDPIVDDSAMFTEAQTKLRLTNDADVPAVVEVSLQNTDQLGVSKTSVKKKLAPNSVELVDLTLTAVAPLDSKDIAPLPVRWKVVYDLEESIAPLTIEGEHRIGIRNQWPMVQPPTALAMDGDVGEWESLMEVAGPGAVNTYDDAWYGAQDASLAFAVAHDTEFVYVALRVTDDEQASSNTNYRRTDSLAIRLDARPADKRGRGSDFKDWLLLAFSGGRRASGELFEAEQLPEGIVVKNATTGNGYSAEVAVPMSYIVAQGGGDWKDIRVNVTVQDHDKDGYAEIWWQPDWNAADSYVGRGVFARP